MINITEFLFHHRLYSNGGYTSFFDELSQIFLGLKWPKKVRTKIVFIMSKDGTILCQELFWARSTLSVLCFLKNKVNIKVFVTGAESSLSSPTGHPSCQDCHDENIKKKKKKKKNFISWKCNALLNMTNIKAYIFFLNLSNQLEYSHWS